MEPPQGDTGARFDSFPTIKMRSREDVIEELSRPCGRFKQPQNLEEQLSLYIAERFRTIDPLGENQLYAGSGVPLNWHQLLRYLHTQKIITEPSFHKEPVANDRPKISCFGLTIDQTGRKTDGWNKEYMGGYGTGLTNDEALSKTIGETLERFFLSRYSKKSMIRGSYRSLVNKGYNLIDINLLNTFLPWQKEAFPEFITDEDTQFNWVWGESYPNGKAILIPAQLVFWNYMYDGNDADQHEKLLIPVTTSGCAGHFSREEAVLAGLLENIQRDGFLIYWLNHLSPPVLDVSLLEDPDIDALLKRLHRYRLTVHFLNTTSDIAVPSITCVITDPYADEGPVISLGSSTGFDIKKNILQAADEAVLVNNAAVTLPTHTIPDDYVPFTDHKLDRQVRLGAWKGQLMAERFSFFISGKKQDPRELSAICGNIDTPRARLDYLLQEFEKLGSGYEVFVYEAHDPVLDTLGFHAVRTIIPQIVPLYLLEHNAQLSARRLREVPKN